MSITYQSHFYKCSVTNSTGQYLGKTLYDEPPRGIFLVGLSMGVLVFLLLFNLSK